jgi:hypothetical protein
MRALLTLLVILIAVPGVAEDFDISGITNLLDDIDTITTPGDIVLNLDDTYILTEESLKTTVSKRDLCKLYKRALPYVLFHEDLLISLDHDDELAIDIIEMIRCLDYPAWRCVIEE